MKDIVP